MDLDFNLEAMVEVFGEPDERRSHPDRGYYWFEYRREDGVGIRLSLDAYERVVNIGIGYGPVGLTSIHLERCDRVRVLEPAKPNLEVVAREFSTRCFLALDGESILTIDVPADSD